MTQIWDLLMMKLALTSDEHGANMRTIKMDEQEVMKPSHDEYGLNTESKQQKTIRNIWTALKEGKVRENSSLMKGNGAKPGGQSTQKQTQKYHSKFPNPVLSLPVSSLMQMPQLQSQPKQALIPQNRFKDHIL